MKSLSLLLQVGSRLLDEGSKALDEMEGEARIAPLQVFVNIVYTLIGGQMIFSTGLRCWAV